VIYQNFQAYSDITGPVRAIADMAAAALVQPLPGLSRNAFQRAVAALCQLVARAGLSHRRPAFGIDTVNIREGLVAVRETAVHQTPFCTLLHLEKDLVAAQPCVAVLAAAAIMAEDADPAQPRSMTLMAGPIDARVNPTEVNRLATSRSIEWFERNLIGVVPLRYAGALRRVYPGFVQLAAFMSMNLDRHVKAQIDLFCHLANGDDEKAAAIRAFYDEYCAVMDLPAEFYLQTVRTVFQEHALPLGKFEWRGRRVDPSAIRRTALFTVEGERDDICAVGQTLAAQELCSSLRPYMKRHHVQTGVGHYGVFNGRRWSNFIYPIMRNIIYASD